LPTRDAVNDVDTLQVGSALCGREKCPCIVPPARVLVRGRVEHVRAGEGSLADRQLREVLGLEIRRNSTVRGGLNVLASDVICLLFDLKLIMNGPTKPE
jgi:hypothetical protein